jgi:hypothetical protein
LIPADALRTRDAEGAFSVFMENVEEQGKEAVKTASPPVTATLGCRQMVRWHREKVPVTVTVTEVFFSMQPNV